MATTVKERIEEYTKYIGISVREFERSIGASNGYSKIMSAKISVERLNEIRRVYPALNVDWLLYGEGDMLVSSGNGIVNSNQIVGNGNVQGDVHQTSTDARLLEELSAQRRLVEQAQEQTRIAQEQARAAQEQTARALALIEKLLNNPPR
ncbi:MAG: hypothetical protein LUC22_00310 [Prevotella sp.]|nr:hypothetical protein [Prevotella sp.]